MLIIHYLSWSSFGTTVLIWRAISPQGSSGNVTTPVGSPTRYSSPKQNSFNFISVVMTNDTAAIAILCLLGFLSFIVFISNTFTVFVFWIHRKKLTRTSFLVINLAVADLFSGLTEIIEVAGGWTLASQIHSNKTIQEVIPPSLQIVFSFASVLFLVLISLHQGLHLQYSYRMVSWDSYRCERFHCFTWNLQIHIFRGWCGGHHWFLLNYDLCILPVHQEKN